MIGHSDRKMSFSDWPIQASSTEWLYHTLSTNFPLSILTLFLHIIYVSWLLCGNSPPANGRVVDDKAFGEVMGGEQLCALLEN
jgi:hypothetical protein